MKSLLTILKNNVWYIVIGATVVVAGAGLAITRPWEDNSLTVGTWEVYEIMAFNSSISSRILIENDEQRSKSLLDETKTLSDSLVNEYHCAFTNKVIDQGNCGISKNVLGLNSTMEKFEVSKIVFDAINYGIEMNDKTNGYFSIAQGKILSLWKDELIGKKGPNFSEADAVAALAYVESKVDQFKNTAADNATLETKEENGKYYVQRKADVTVDLGGIAKAILTDKLNSLYIEKGYSRFFINSGGSSWTIKGKYMNTTGKIGVVNPAFVDACGSYELMGFCDTTEDGEYYKAIDIDVTDISLGTSGDYAANNFIEVAGNKYHHIINPKTGRPSEGIRSTTIVANNAMEADVWSTALMAMGVNDAKTFFTSNPDIIATYYDGIAKKTELTTKAKESNKITVCQDATNC